MAPSTDDDVARVTGIGHASPEARCISDIPFGGPAAATRIGYIDEEFVVNPTYQELEVSQLDLVAASTRDGVLMLEAGANQLSEEVVLGAIRRGHEANQEVIALQEEMLRSIGKAKIEFNAGGYPDELGGQVAALADGRLTEALDAPGDKAEQADRLGTLGDDYALAAGGYQDLSRYFALQGQVDAKSDPLEWSTITGDLGGLTGLYLDTPLEAPLRARVSSILAPEFKRIGYTAEPGEPVTVTNLRETLVGILGANGDADVAAKARDYVGKLATNPTAIPTAIRTPILSTYARNATPAEWDALLALTKAETNPVTKNRFVNLLGSARDDALAARALELLKTNTFTDPQKAGLLRAIAGRHPDMAFDWAVQNRELVNGFVEQSSEAGYIVGLGGGSNDPAMPGKIKAYAEQYLPEASRGGATRVIAGIAVRKAAAERLRPAVEKWLGR